VRDRLKDATGALLLYLALVVLEAFTNYAARRFASYRVAMTTAALSDARVGSHVFTEKETPDAATDNARHDD
jgi:hypothetical protein